MIQNWNNPDFFLTDDNFTQRMQEEVTPFLQDNVKEGDITSYDGTQLHYYYLLNPDEKAAITISHGFCEFFGKYHEASWYLYKAGYSVFFVEYRGHGHSQRYTDDMDKVHLDKGFEEYVGDLKALFDQVVKKYSISGNYYLFAHSMGGAIGTMFLETYPEIMQKAVLSSPMMKANYAGIPEGIVRVMMVVGKILGWSEKWAPGQSSFDFKDHFEDSCADSRARYDYVQNLRLQDSQCRNNGGTFGWSGGAVHAAAFIRKNAAKVQIPVLLFQAGRDNLVIPEAQDYFVTASGNTCKKTYPDSKHEIFNSSDQNIRSFFNDILTFYES